MADVRLLKAFHQFELGEDGTAKQIMVLRFKVATLGPFEVKVPENATLPEKIEAMDRYAREFAGLVE